MNRNIIVYSILIYIYAVFEKQNVNFNEYYIIITYY
jgi:hypothetical protein